MIEIQEVSKRFGSVSALQGVSLKFELGERVALVGSNGSGKTTLLRALLGLIRVSGRVLIAGHDVAKRPELALAKVAYVPQIAPPLEAPVRDVIGAYAALRGIATERVAKSAAQLGLQVPPLERTRFRDLSGGQKQKLLAALALAVDAKVLVCDEPTANLDEQARTAFFAELADKRAERVLLLCSHRAEELAHSVDRVVELRDGLVARDEPALHPGRARLQVVQ